MAGAYDDGGRHDYDGAPRRRTLRLDDQRLAIATIATSAPSTCATAPTAPT